MMTRELERRLAEAVDDEHDAGRCHAQAGKVVDRPGNGRDVVKRERQRLQLAGSGGKAGQVYPGRAVGRGDGS